MGIVNGTNFVAPELYEKYYKNLRKAVEAVPIDDADLKTQWQANISRFSAYKAFHATDELRRTAKKELGDLALLRAIYHKYNRYQASEYNTAVARARTGKQWSQFNNPDNVRLFPCIKWLPSRSAVPREEHRIFWDHIWRKDDPFWLTNQPGTIWNCKCDWEEVDEDPTPDNDKVEAEMQKRISDAKDIGKPNPFCLPGLDENPATSGQIFTDTAPYISSCSKTRSKKIEGWTAERTFYGEAYENTKQFQGQRVPMTLKNVTTGEDFNTDIIFDANTNSHIANDIATNKGDFLMKELSANLPYHIKRSTLVAHEPNTKPEKRWTTNYYYYEYRIGGKTYYFNIEERDITPEKRHEFRLYSITTKLRKSADKY